MMKTPTSSKRSASLLGLSSWAIGECCSARGERPHGRIFLGQHMLLYMISWRAKGQEYMSVLVVDSDAEQPRLTPHLLPCEIAYTGPAPVSTYFKTREAAEPEQQEAHFRGRRLLGKSLPLPEACAFAAPPCRACCAARVPPPHLPVHIRRASPAPCSRTLWRQA